METVTDFLFLGSKITADSDCSHEIKRRLLLWRKAMTNLKVKGLVTQLYPILCDPMDCSLPGSSVHGILQSRLLEWFPCLLAGEYSLPRNEPRSPALAGGFFTTSTTWKTQIILGVPKAHCPYTSCNVTAHFFVHLPSHTVSTMRPGGTSYSNF